MQGEVWGAGQRGLAERGLGFLALLVESEPELVERVEERCDAPGLAQGDLLEAAGQRGDHDLVPEEEHRGHQQQREQRGGGQDV
jgi:hypothetical protein